MGEVRLLHLSDLHFCRVPDNRDLASLLRADLVSAFRVFSFADKIYRFASHRAQLADVVAQFVYREHAGLDGIIITGDAATTGAAADLAAVAAYVDSPCANKWLRLGDLPGLNSCGLPIFLLPGNHDRYLDEGGTAGGQQFEAAFSRYWAPGQRIRTWLLEAADGERLAIVAADFSLRRNVDGGRPETICRYGRGRAYNDTLSELRRTTRRLQREGAAVIWAMHFPPEPPQENTALSLLNGSAVAAAASRSRVRHILAGHIHRRLRYWRNDGQLEILCASSSTAVSESANEIHVLMFDISDGEIRQCRRDNHVYSPQSQTFELVEEFDLGTTS